jgi:hypothetical protein
VIADAGTSPDRRSSHYRHARATQKYRPTLPAAPAWNDKQESVIASATLPLA